MADLTKSAVLGAVPKSHVAYFPVVGGCGHAASAVTRLQRIYPRQSLRLGQGQRHPRIHKKIETN